MTVMKRKSPSRITFSFFCEDAMSGLLTSNIYLEILLRQYK